jgi:hypothetical protein
MELLEGFDSQKNGFSEPQLKRQEYPVFQLAQQLLIKFST